MVSKTDFSHSGKAVRMADALVVKKANKRLLSESSSSETSSSEDSEGSSTNSSGSDSFDEEGPNWSRDKKRATYHEWRSFLMKTYIKDDDAHFTKPAPSPYKTIAPNHNSHKNDAQAHNPYKNGTPAPNSYKTDAQTPNPFRNGTPTFNSCRTVPTHIPFRTDAPTPSPIKPTQSVLSRTKTTSSAIHSIKTVTPVLTRTVTSVPNPIKPVTAAFTRTVTSAPNPIKPVSSSLSNFKTNAPSTKHTRTVVPAIKNANTVPPTSKASQTVTQDLSASLRSIYETFWSLNSAAKLIHVKSQLDEPSKIYVNKLIKAHGNLVQENSRLKKEKQDLINVIKKIEIAISNETIANLLEPGRSAQPKNS